MTYKLILLAGALTFSTQVSALPVANPGPVTGWGSYKFGMSLSDMRRAWPNAPWTSESMVDCRKRVHARYGCRLALPRQTFFHIGRNRLPFTATAYLVHDHLEEIWLSQVRHGVSPRRCLQSYAAFLDGLWQRFGPLESASHPRDWFRDDWTRDQLHTPQGHPFSWVHARHYNDGGVEDARTNRPAVIPRGITDNIDNWGGSHVRMGLDYIDYGSAQPSLCRLTVAYLSKSAGDRLAKRS